MKKTRLFSLLLSLVMVATMFPLVAFAEDGVVLGDVNRSGAVDTDDVFAILQMAGGIEYADLSVADMNGDGMVSLSDALAALDAAANINTDSVIPDKNGDNFLSVDPDNEFIKLVISKYNKPVQSLVAIYSVPDSGVNYVLQFSSKNNYEKSPANLERVYHIGKAPEREISYTEGKLIGGNYNCSGAEGMVVFELVKTEVMPQYPGFFVGL